MTFKNTECDLTVCILKYWLQIKGKGKIDISHIIIAAIRLRKFEIATRNFISISYCKRFPQCKNINGVVTVSATLESAT